MKRIIILLLMILNFNFSAIGNQSDEENYFILEIYYNNKKMSYEGNFEIEFFNSTYFKQDTTVLKPLIENGKFLYPKELNFKEVGTVKIKITNPNLFGVDYFAEFSLELFKGTHKIIFEITTFPTIGYNSKDYIKILQTKEVDSIQITQSLYFNQNKSVCSTNARKE